VDAGLRLSKILIFAPDLEAAREFYAKVLGLHLEHSEDRLLRFEGVNFELYIFKCESSSDCGGYSRRAGSAVAFAVPSIALSMRELQSKGVRFLHERPNEGPDGTLYVAFTDPFGTVFELIEEEGDGRIASCA
jgi:glyoxylase I family protein